MSVSIKQSAEEYKPQNLKNIVDLKTISVDLVLLDGEGTDPKDNSIYKYKYIEVENQKYRFPESVLKDLNLILSKKPNLKTFSVIKSGEGKNTRYTVMPLD